MGRTLHDSRGSVASPLVETRRAQRQIVGANTTYQLHPTTHENNKENQKKKKDKKFTGGSHSRVDPKGRVQRAPGYKTNS